MTSAYAEISYVDPPTGELGDDEPTLVAVERAEDMAQWYRDTLAAAALAVVDESKSNGESRHFIDAYDAVLTGRV